MQNKQKLILFVVLLFYTIIGLLHANNQGFWHDEIYTMAFLKGISAYTFTGNTLNSITGAIPVHYIKEILLKDNFISNLKTVIQHEGHPPLYFLLLKLWASIFGYSELALRSFSLLCGLFSMVTIFSLVKNKFETTFTAWIILILLLFNPYLFYYFTEARMYALAFLLGIITFKYWLKYKEHRVFKSLDFLIFTVSALALLYTHYYGLFFFTILVLYDTLRQGISFKILNYSIPIVLFLPWSFVIKSQTEFHKIHWTDGSYSLLNSFIGFGKGLISLFFSPMSDARDYESFIAVIASIVLFYFVAKTWKQRFLYLSIAIIFFLQIFIFDKILNHHTIVVPRYYIFILIFIYWAIAKAIKRTPKTITLIFTLSYCFIAGYAFYQINTLTLARKQMYRELAFYIDSKHEEKSTVILVEPGGPIVWGLSYYLKKDFSIVSAEHVKNIKNSKKIIYVDEMLGDKFWENHLYNAEQQNLKLVPFAGLFLYE